VKTSKVKGFRKLAASYKNRGTASEQECKGAGERKS